MIEKILRLVLFVIDLSLEKNLALNVAGKYEPRK